MNNRDFDVESLDIINRLQRKGFEAYFVGGCIRDLKMGRQPKDFDIATNAKPREIKRLIHQCFIIGRRFQLVLARRGPKQYEIATFRKETPVKNHYQWVDENLFGTPADDALRRDFTLNALFYDPNKKKVLDFVEGSKDIRQKMIRVIGDPLIRFQEDPIRMLRAIRFAARLRFQIAPETLEGIKHCAFHLALSVPDRLREELIRMLKEGESASAWDWLEKSHALEHFLPEWNELHHFWLPPPMEGEIKENHQVKRAKQKKLGDIFASLFSSKRTKASCRGDRLVVHMLKQIDKKKKRGEEVPTPLALAAFFLPVLRLTCHALYGHWKTPSKTQLEELKFFNELHHSLRLSKQENSHVRFLIANRPHIFHGKPRDNESRFKGTLLKHPGFSFLLELCEWEAGAHDVESLRKNCRLWRKDYDALVASGFKPKEWEALGPYAKKNAKRNQRRRFSKKKKTKFSPRRRGKKPTKP